MASESERPPTSGLGSQGDPAVVAARGTLRDALGSLRNLTQLLASLRVAPKSVAAVLPDVLEACGPMHQAVATLIDALGSRAAFGPERAELETFLGSRIDTLEGVMRDAVARPMSAKVRLTLEDVVTRCSFELDAACGLLQLFEDAVYGQRVRLCPLDLVRQTFARPRERDQGRRFLSAVLSSHEDGGESEIHPRATTALLGLGVELVGEREQNRQIPHVTVTSDVRGNLTIEIVRRSDVSGEPLVLATRGVIAPTLRCLVAAARLCGGRLDWNAERETFALEFPHAEARVSGWAPDGGARYKGSA